MELGSTASHVACAEKTRGEFFQAEVRMSLNRPTPHDAPPAGYPPLPLPSGAPPQYAAPQYPQPYYSQPQAWAMPAPPVLKTIPTPPPAPSRNAARAEKDAGLKSEARSENKPLPQAKSPPALIAQPAGATDDAATLAAEEREQLEARQRAIVAGAASMIVHLVILITLGLLGSTPKTDTRGGIALEASIAKLDDVLHSEAARIDLLKPATIDAGRPTGSSNMTGSPILLPGAIGMNAVGVPIAPPNIVGAPVGAGGGDGQGSDMPAGGIPAHTKPGDGNGATFFDIPATGRKIAFVVDTSGSMYDNDRYLRCRAELIESLRTLKPKQFYYIVLFSDRLFPMPGRRLTEATPGNLYRTIAWLNGADPTGTTEPLPALRQALQQRPDAIFLLTDGSFEEGTLEKILKLQTSSKKVPIHTIAFEGQDGEETLQAISRATGGKYRYVK